MSRYRIEIPTSLPHDSVNAIFNGIAAGEGFQMVAYKGETVYSKGLGMMIPPQYFTFKLMGDTVIIEAWMKCVLFPGIFFGEIKPGFFAGAIASGKLTDRVNKIVMLLQQAEQAAQKPAAAV